MKMRIGLAALALLTLTGAANANGADKKGCEPDCYKTVTKSKIVGYKWARVPVRKKYEVKEKVTCKDDCEPVKVQAGPGVDIPSPPPAVVIQNQKVLVITRPIVEYAPVPPVRILPAPEVVYHQPTLVRAPPPPMVQVVRAPAQCRPVVAATCNGCQPIRTACVPPGHHGPANAHGARQQAATPSIGKMTGLAGNCPAGTAVGQPYECKSSSTGFCICK